MKLRLAKCCSNCEHFKNGQNCVLQNIIVSQNQVCESYQFNVVITREDDCLKCSKFQTQDCSHPKIADKGLLCSTWYPRNAKAM